MRMLLFRVETYRNGRHNVIFFGKTQPTKVIVHIVADKVFFFNLLTTNWVLMHRKMF